MIEIPEYVVFNKDLNATDVRIYAVIKSMCSLNKGGQLTCSPSIENICKQLGLSRWTVSTSITKMVNNEIIERHRRFNHSNVYIL